VRYLVRKGWNNMNKPLDSEPQMSGL